MKHFLYPYGPKRLLPLCGTCLLLFSLPLWSGCGEKKSSSSTKQEHSLRLEIPSPPITLVSPEERAKYVLLRYWDNFDFADTTLIAQPAYTEQAFVDFIHLFSLADSTVLDGAVCTLLEKSHAADTAMFGHFSRLFERYLYDPNSPMRNEEFYLPVLRYLVNSERVDEVHKIRPRYLLDLALKNRPGAKAIDFTFELIDGTKRKLSSVKAERMVLFFNNPDCHDCARVKTLLQQITVDDAKVVAIYSDEEVELWKKTVYPKEWINGYSAELRTHQMYDLRAIPTLYLLDGEQRVLLKDVRVEELLNYLDKERS